MSEHEITSLPAPYMPVEVDDLLLAFPGSIRHLMPNLDTIERAPEWEELANDWFSGGLTDISLLPTLALTQDDTSPEDAWRHLRCVMGSFEPKHEDKIAAIGFLLSRWFRWAQWETARGVVKIVGDRRLPESV